MAPLAEFNVIGVDGCKRGWCAVAWDGQETRLTITRHFADVLAMQADIIAVDMPIGLPATGQRQAESAGRAMLGKRKSSLFPVPTRAALLQHDYHAACAENMKHTDPPRKMPKQSFYLFPKMREIDALMTPELQIRVHEIHPEVSFCMMNEGFSLAHSKSKPEGVAERRLLLQGVGFPHDHLLQNLRGSGAKPDDVLDACAAAWTAQRILRKQARVFPEIPQAPDERGLAMMIKA